MIRAIIVDDEELARQRLRMLLSEGEIPVEVVGEAESGQAAIPLIHESRPDVVFLDVRMPVLDGFDVVELLPKPRPHIVFVTAYDEHALRAFEVHALDYLTKPVRASRLAETLRRINMNRTDAGPKMEEAVRTRVAEPLRRLTVHAGRKLKVIRCEDIGWIEAEEKEVKVHTADGIYPTDFTLDELEGRLDARTFLRPHRSFLVNATRVVEVVKWFGGTYALKLGDGTRIPVARRRAKQIREALAI